MDFKQNILDILGTIKKEGSDKLIEFLKDSTFFTDPAHAYKHNSYVGGLAEHSYHTYQVLDRFCSGLPDKEKYEDSIKIIGLLHDISLMGAFQKSFKNLPLKDASGKNKLDEKGKLIFIERDIFEYNPNKILPYPQGHLSNNIIKRFLKLTVLEDLSILWINGDPKNDLASQAYATSKIIFYSYLANIEAELYYKSSLNSL